MSNKDEFKEEIDKQLHDNDDIDVDDLSLKELLAGERTSLASQRNEFSLKRSLQSAERTFTSWIRTGFSIVSASVTLTGLLSKSEIVAFSNTIGVVLILLGSATFIYAWHSYYRTYKFLKILADEEHIESVLQKSELIIITIIAFTLLIASIAAFAVILLR